MGLITLDCGNRFGVWRQQARWLLSHQVDPSEAAWATPGVGDLFAAEPVSTDALGPVQARIPQALLKLLEDASQYRGEQRWSLLYEVLWRVSHGDRTAMLAGDKVGSELHRRIKQVSREAHHLHAFLRFVEWPEALWDVAVGERPEFVAWHEPAHDILVHASQHFVGRMGQHRWLIATPGDGVYFDGERLHHWRECPPYWQERARAAQDPHSDLWLTYYSHIFNPARLNPKVMQGHLPSRFWKNLPEGPLIPELISQARSGKQRDGQAQAIGLKPGKRIVGKPSKPPQ